jgi:hypothetical protein
MLTQGASLNLATVLCPGLVGAWRMPLLPPSSLLHSILVAIEPWTGAQRASAVKRLQFRDRSA